MVALLVARADVRFRIIPNKLVCVLTLWALYLHGLSRWGASTAFVLPSSTEAFMCCVGMLLCASVAELLLRRLRGQVGIGFGDIKYLAAWSLLLGWKTLFAFSASCLFGGLWAFVHKQENFALGPWISLCCSAAWIAGQLKLASHLACLVHVGLLMWLSA